MKKKKWEIERRTFLRNSGIVMALPVLNAMAPSIARAADGGKTQRLFHIWHPNGVPTPTKANGWPYLTWAEYGSCDIHPRLENQLSKVKEYVTHVCGLKNEYKEPSNRKQQRDFGPKQHHPHASCMISAHCGKIISRESDMLRTFDQHIAYSGKHDGSMYKSIAINVNPRLSDTGQLQGQVSMTGNLLNTISWLGPSDPLKHHYNPRVLFDLLFKGGGAPITQSTNTTDFAERRKMLGKKLILDNLIGEIKTLQKKLGKEDRVTLDKYFTDIEELDRKTASLLNNEEAEASPSPQPIACEKGVRPPSMPGYGLNQDTFVQRRDLMQDIVIKAFQCDLTRVCSMMLANNGGFGTSFNIPGMQKGPIKLSDADIEAGKKVRIGFQNAWHPNHHWNGASAGYINNKVIAHANFVTINEFIYKGLGELALKMKNTPTLNGKNLLDETLIVFGTTMGNDKGGHGYANWSRVLIGSGGGAFKMGQKFKYPVDKNNKSISSLWLSVMKGFGVNMNKFGDTSEFINEILA